MVGKKGSSGYRFIINSYYLELFLRIYDKNNTIMGLIGYPGKTPKEVAIEKINNYSPVEWKPEYDKIIQKRKNLSKKIALLRKIEFITQYKGIYSINYDGIINYMLINILKNKKIKISNLNLIKVLLNEYLNEISKITYSKDEKNTRYFDNKNKDIYIGDLTLDLIFEDFIKTIGNYNILLKEKNVNLSSTTPNMKRHIEINSVTLETTDDDENFIKECNKYTTKLLKIINFGFVTYMRFITIDYKISKV